MTAVRTPRPVLSPDTGALNVSPALGKRSGRGDNTLKGRLGPRRRRPGTASQAVMDGARRASLSYKRVVPSWAARLTARLNHEAAHREDGRPHNSPIQPH
jgi:hypothetical protein